MRALALLVLLVSSLAAQPDRPPNFILIFADDQGWGDLGVQGHPDIRTPHIDRLAREGVRFTSFYAAPFCGPSRAALMTGSYPPRNSLAFNHGPKSTTGIHPNEITVAELLKTRGYATRMIGKWHLGSKEPFLPHRHGFDHWFGLPYSNDMWRYHPLMPPRPDEDARMRAARERADYTGYAGQGRHYDLDEGQGFPEPLPLMENAEVLELDPDQRGITTRYTDRALDFIDAHWRQQCDEPFFLYLPLAMPHVPLFTSERWEGRSIRGLYGDVIEEIDASVGRLRTRLEQLGIDRRTMIVYTSDNGPWLQYGVDAGSAGPLRDGKATTYEGGMRVPGIFWWPGRIPGGRVTSAIASNMDILPTFARLAGAEPPTDRTIDGRDLWPLLSVATDRSPYEHFYYFGGGRDFANLRGVRSGKWKLELERPAPETFEVVALYDLHEDVSEKFDRKELFPEIVEELLDRAKAFVRDLEAEQRPLGRL
jgi:arylsulfatase A